MAFGQLDWALVATDLGSWPQPFGINYIEGDRLGSSFEPCARTYCRKGCKTAQKLTVDRINAGLQSLDGWVHNPASNVISRTFKFKDFSEAFGFISQVALAAQQADHHPDWSNSYDTVIITLSTHDAGGVTDKDLALAKAIDRLVG